MEGEAGQGAEGGHEAGEAQEAKEETEATSQPHHGEEQKIFSRELWKGENKDREQSGANDDEEQSIGGREEGKSVQERGGESEKPPSFETINSISSQKHSEARAPTQERSGLSSEATATQIICLNSFEEGCDGSMVIDSVEEAERACEAARPFPGLLAFSGSAAKVREKILETQRTALPSNFKPGALLSTPAQALSSGEYCSAGAKFVALDLKSLHKLALGPEADESGDAHPGVIKLVQTVVREAGKRGVETILLAEWRISQELAQKLVEAGVEGVAVLHEDLPHSKRLVSSVEKKLLLRKARG